MSSACFFVQLMNQTCTQDGDTSLIRASYWGETDAVEILLGAGAKVNKQNDVSVADFYAVEMY